MIKIGYPSTLCGRHNYYGNGCAECCYGHIVKTDPENWDKIIGGLSPVTLNIAAGKSVTRLEQVQTGLTQEVLSIAESDVLGMHELARYYTQTFPEQFAYSLRFEGQAFNIIRQEIPTYKPKPFTPEKALSNTNYAIEHARSLMIESDLETRGNLVFLLIEALSRQLEDAKEGFLDDPLDLRILYMISNSPDRLKSPCPLLNTNTGKCISYENRPEVCKAAGCYAPQEIGFTGCGANLLYSSLSSQSTAITPQEHVMLNRRVRNTIGNIPLEFFLVRALANRNKDFALDPIGSSLKLSPRKKRH